MYKLGRQCHFVWEYRRNVSTLLFFGFSSLLLVSSCIIICKPLKESALPGNEALLLAYFLLWIKKKSKTFINYDFSSKICHIWRLSWIHSRLKHNVGGGVSYQCLILPLH